MSAQIIPFTLTAARRRGPRASAQLAAPRVERELGVRGLQCIDEHLAEHRRSMARQAAAMGVCARCSLPSLGEFVLVGDELAPMHVTCAGMEP
jgi:hypothetical protein